MNDVLFKTCNYLEDYVRSNKIIGEEEIELNKLVFVSKYTNGDGFIETDYCVSYIHYLSNVILGYDR